MALRVGLIQKGERREDGSDSRAVKEVSHEVSQMNWILRTQNTKL